MSVFIVAELSANHKQDLSLAKESLYAIKECGADAIKLQTYTPDSLTLDCKSEIFKISSNSPWDNKYLYDLYKEAYMPLEWNHELFALARKIGLFCFSSAFDREGVDLLESIGNPIYKIASFEVRDLDLIDYIASKGKPIMLSSGIATKEELREAIECIKSHNIDDITLLKCTSAYPAKLESLQLSLMPKEAMEFGIKYGLSDHSHGNLASIIATSLGASVIEKHFILDKSLGGVDSTFSLDRREFSDLIKAIRDTQKALGESHNKEVESKDSTLDSTKNIESSMLDSTQKVIDSSDYKEGREFSRSLFVSKDIKKGEILTRENIKSLRPNAGLPPKYLKDILGKSAKRDLSFGKPLEWEDFS